MASIQDSRDMNSADRLTLVELKPYQLLALFNLALSYSIALGASTRISAFLFANMGWPEQVVNLALAFAFGIAGILTLLFVRERPIALYAYFPVMLYNLITLLIVLQLNNRPSGGEVVSFFMILYLYQNFEFAARKQAHEAIAAELAALKLKLSEARGSE